MINQQQPACCGESGQGWAQRIEDDFLTGGKLGWAYQGKVWLSDVTTEIHSGVRQKRIHGNPDKYIRKQQEEMGLWFVVSNLASQTKHISELTSGCEPPVEGPQDKKKEEKESRKMEGTGQGHTESKKQEGSVEESDGSPQSPDAAGSGRRCGWREKAKLSLYSWSRNR